MLDKSCKKMKENIFKLINRLIDHKVVAAAAGALVRAFLSLIKCSGKIWCEVKRLMHLPNAAFICGIHLSAERTIVCFGKFF